MHITTVRVSQVVDAEIDPNDWTRLDSWWTARCQSPTYARRTASSEIWATNARANWADLDPWWTEYLDVGNETAGRIADLLDRATERWEQSDAPFETDPLAVDVSGDRGPLRPAIEVEWSRWLARLLGPSAAFVSELVEPDINAPPTEVARETRLTRRDGEGYRRPDLVVRTPSRGISVEVKLDDENYRKTAETARLVERRDDDREWTHTLLLPQSKLARLDAIVDPPLESRPDGRRQIPWDDPTVTVLCWRDVTRALRSVVTRGDAVDDHWAANAYLFCAAVEQHVLDFQSQPVIERLASPSTVTDAIQPIEITETLDEQLQYLQETTNP